MTLTGHNEAGLEHGRVDLQRYDHALMGTYGTPQRVLVRGEGSWVWDADGNRYLDLLGGIAVNALGHAHPAWVEAVSAQAATLTHTSNFFATEPQIRLAERLLTLAHAPSGSRVFLCNSGAEANEAALKLARRTGRRTVIALEGGFHGRTAGALSVTAKEALRAPFEPLVAGAVFVPPTVDAIREAASAAGEDLAAILVEPIQGEAGVRPVPVEVLRVAREAAHRHGALLVMDEVQTGVGRTGAWFAHQLAGVVPDVMTLAKGLGGGFPVGAVVAFGERAATALVKGDHGTTFGGNPLASAAALATLDAIEADGLLDHARSQGEHLRAALAAVPGVTEVRGAGLMLGIGLAAPVAPAVVAAALADGFIVNAPDPATIRLVPALTLTRAEADAFLAWAAAHLPALVTKEPA
ncbi:acetylornithine transaminase [Demequina pelophila]|uniref:acetylornithine transaminase n=1 Tax=Demequina pelophila TaxID=1638984 RepID=UPI000784B6B2|nr:acetylornithine transaminase [Demequina pelophila]